MSGRPHIIVVGNEKGGSGKSTVAMHAIVALLADGHKVGSIDLDSRQGTLSRYVENRRHSSETMSKPLPMPDHIAVPRSKAASVADAAAEEAAALDDALKELS